MSQKHFISNVKNLTLIQKHTLVSKVYTESEHISLSTMLIKYIIVVPDFV